MSTATETLSSGTQEVVTTNHPLLRFRKEESRQDGAKGCLLIDGYVEPAKVLAEARRQGAVNSTGSGVYYIVEFTTGFNQKDGPGGRNADYVKRALKRMQD
ncbi:MAG TPA: hypothetical protein VIF43_01145 [Patescibacteria group bacterium]